MYKGVENRAIGIWDDLYRGLPRPVKSFLSVIIVSTTLMLGALFFTTQLLPDADSLISTLVDALERQIEGQNVKNKQLEILGRKMVKSLTLYSSSPKNWRSPMIGFKTRSMRCAAT